MANFRPFCISIEGLGYTSAASQLLTVPLYTSGIISVITLSWFADRRQVRWIFVTVPYLVAAAGFLALIAIPHPKYVPTTFKQYVTTLTDEDCTIRD